MSKKIENKEVETNVDVEVKDLEEVESAEAAAEESGEEKKRFGGFKKNAKKLAIGAGLLIGGVLLGRSFASKSARDEDEVDGDVEDGADVEVTEF